MHIVAVSAADRARHEGVRQPRVWVPPVRDGKDISRPSPAGRSVLAPRRGRL